MRVTRSPLTDAQRALVEAHLDWAQRGARKYHQISRGRYTLDELTSAAYHALCLAAQRFDPSRGFTFKTYAMSWTECYLRRVHHTSCRVNGGRYRDWGAVDPVMRRVAWPTDEDGHALDVFPAPEENLDAAMLREQQRALILSAHLSPSERLVVAGKLDGKSDADLADALGMSRSGVQAAWKRAKPKIERRLKIERLRRAPTAA